MSEDTPQAPDRDSDSIPPRPLPSWPWLTMLLNLALIVTIFVTRERWEAWVVEADLPDMLEYGVSVKQMPGGRRALIFGSNGVCLWDIKGARSVACFGRSRQRFDKWAVSPRGDVIAVARHHVDKKGVWGQCREAALIDAETGQQTCRLDFEPGVAWSMANCLAFSHAGSLLALGLMDGRAFVWSIPAGKQLFALSGQQNVCSMAFSDDDSLLVTASQSTGDTVYVWDMGSAQCLMKCRGGHFCGFCAGGRNIVTKETRTQSSWLWGIAGRSKLASWSSFDFPVPALDGSTISLRTADGLVDILDAETGRVVALGTKPEPGRVSPDGRWRVFSTAEHALAVLSVEAGRPARVLPPTAPASGWRYDFLGDGERLLTWVGDYESSTRIWSMSRCEEVARFRCKKRPFVLGPRRIVASLDVRKWCVIARVRPEWWWGVLWLPHFWLIVALGGCVFASGWRDVRRMRRHERQAECRG